MDLILVPKLLLRITAVVVVSCSASYGKSNNRMRIIARLRGACGVVPRPIPSLAVVWGATICSAPIRSTVSHEAASREDRLFLVQFDVEELRGDVGLFRGGLIHDGLRVCDSSIQRQGSGRGGRNFH